MFSLSVFRSFGLSVVVLSDENIKKGVTKESEALHTFTSAGSVRSGVRRYHCPAKRMFVLVSFLPSFLPSFPAPPPPAACVCCFPSFFLFCFVLSCFVSPFLSLFLCVCLGGDVRYVVRITYQVLSFSTTRYLFRLILIEAVAFTHGPLLFSKRSTTQLTRVHPDSNRMDLITRIYYLVYPGIIEISYHTRPGRYREYKVPGKRSLPDR